MKARNLANGQFRYRGGEHRLPDTISGIERYSRRQFLSDVDIL